MHEEIDFLGKGWNFPILVKGVELNGEPNQKVAYAEGEELIRQSILMILGTAKGERVMRPGFGCGIHELVFAPNNTATASLIAYYVKEALTNWEPRVELGAVEVEPDLHESARLNINISYRVKTTNTKANLVYPFYLEGKDGKSADY